MGTNAPSASTASNPMSALLNAFSNNANGSNSGGSNPLASLMNVFANNNANNGQSQQQNNNNNRNPLMLINRTIKFLMDSISMSELNMAQNGNFSFIRNHWNAVKSFMQNSILSGNDTPMRRHEIAQNYANGFGLYIISQFSSERRDVIRSLTQNLFRHHTPLLIDIVLDSNSEIVFEQRLIDWIANAFSAWIYKLSLKYTNRIEGVKQMFVQLIMNSMQYLNGRANQNELRNKLRVTPQFVDYFVENAKKYHLQTMQKQHSTQQQQGQSSSAMASGGLTRMFH